MPFAWPCALEPALLLVVRPHHGDLEYFVETERNGPCDAFFRTVADSPT